MRLVEGVAREIEDLVVDAVGHVLRHAVFHAAGDAAALVAVHERGALLDDLLLLLLGHGAADHVRLPEREAREPPEDLDDLLLIDDAAVGDGEDRLEQRVLVGDLLRMRRALEKARDAVHRAGAVEGDDGGDVLNALGLEPRADGGDARALELEDALGLARGEHGEGRLVVLRRVLDGKARAVPPHEPLGLGEHREVSEAEKVHLQQPQMLQRRHRILADDAVLVLRERDVFIHGLFRDDDARRVRGGVARHALDGAGGVDERLDALVALIELAQGLGEAQRLVQRHVQRARHELCHGVRLGIAHAQRAPDVADRGAGRHRAEGDDLGDVVVAVFSVYIINNLSAPEHAEVHVDIRHAHALGVEEALEIEAVFHRVDVRDLEAVAHDAARRAAAAGADGDAVSLGVADEVGDDEEIVHEAHAPDHVELIVQLAAHLRAVVAVALAEARVAELGEIGV